jgi:uncharacterized iron-regulated protein
MHGIKSGRWRVGSAAVAGMSARYAAAVARLTASLVLYAVATLALPANGAAQVVDAGSSWRVHDMRAGAAGMLREQDARVGAATGFPELVAAVAAVDAAFIGEQHNDAEAHRLQLRLLEELASSRNRVVVALEMFERDVQPLLDGYLAGTVDEQAFTAGARPWPNYTSDYAPLVHVARANGWPVIAANVPRPIASLVAREGIAAFATLNSAQRAWTAETIRCPADRYYERFAETMAGHSPPSPPGMPPAIDRYYDSQCVKDETMAESVVRALGESGPGSVVVHFNGAFHSDYRLGAVERVVRRIPDVRMLVVTMIPVADPATADPANYPGIADFVIFTQRPETR